MRLSIRMRRLTWLVAGAAISFPVLLAQKPPAGGGSNGGLSSERLSPNPNGTNGTPPTNALNHDVFLAGDVRLEDGTALPQPVTIERVCAGSPRAVAYTDLKGHFSFQIGQTTGVMQDASEENSTSSPVPRAANTNSTGLPQPQTSIPGAQLENCDLRAVLPGYRSDTVPLAGRHLLDNPDIGTIVLHRQAGVEGTVVSMTTLQAPNNARRAYEKGLQAVQQVKLDLARDDFEKAVAAYPRFAAAWFELGKLQQYSQQIEAAQESYTNAIAADPKFMGPYEQLSGLAAKASSWRELADTTERLLALDPVDHPAAYLYNGVANLNLNRIDAAEKSARAGEKLDTGHQYPKLEKLLAMILAQKGDYNAAAEHMRLYLQLVPDGADAARMRVQLGEYERIAGSGAQAKAAPKDGQPGLGNPGPP